MDTHEPQRPAPGILRGSLARITIGGCLGTAYFTIVGSPAQTQFFRAIGADEFFFGLLSGIPMFTLFLQFAGAALANRVHHRRPHFMWLNIVARLLSIPMVAVPLIWAHAPSAVVLLSILFVIAAASALQNIAPPLWYSWMADIIPRRILNRFWGGRAAWLQISWLVAYVGVAVFTYAVALPIRTTYLILVLIAATAGVTDIMLFLRVPEPENPVVRDRPLLTMALEPFRHPEYKTFIYFWCVWSFCITFAMVFMQYYLLKGLQFTVWQTTIAFCTIGVGNALSAKRWGAIADRFGHTPILSLCVMFKPIIVVAFCFVSSVNALWVLPAMFLFDGLWNAGIDVAANGYMMKIAPRENRSMFVAAITGVAGLCGGVGAIAGGAFLNATQGLSWHAFGRVWTNYQLFFLVGALLRLFAASLVRFVREPNCDARVSVVSDVIGDWPLFFSRVPVEIHRFVNQTIGRPKG